MRKLYFILLAAVLSVSCGGGCNLFPPDSSPDVSPVDPVDPVNPDGKKRPAAEYWSELAAQVAAGEFTNTDQVILTAERLKARGLLDDLSRLDGLRQKRLELTDDNRGNVAQTIKGN